MAFSDIDISAARNWAFLVSKKGIKMRNRRRKIDAIVSVSISKKLAQETRVEAAKRGISRSALLRLALTDYLKKEKSSRGLKNAAT